jgi:hypothetical protein
MLGGGGYKLLNSRKLNGKLEVTQTDVLRSIYGERIRKEKDE